MAEVSTRFYNCFMKIEAQIVFEQVADEYVIQFETDAGQEKRFALGGIKPGDVWFAEISADSFVQKVLAPPTRHRAPGNR